jgi:hypothetical protein
MDDKQGGKALAAPALAAVPAPDPIFAAIEKHRSATLALLAEVRENCRLQEELPLAGC